MMTLEPIFGYLICFEVYFGLCDSTLIKRSSLSLIKQSVRNGIKKNKKLETSFSSSQHSMELL
uniref:Putative ovule protein n=1 Tax=Solanum chacoense TaxID=4108 RepID=A0A0V0HNR8_SOLCH